MANKYGKIKIQTESGTEIVPVYELGSSGSDISEFVRVNTEKGKGFIPIASVSNDVAYPFIRVQGENETYAVHNSASLVSTTTFVEDFEDRDISEYSGDTSYFSVHDTRAYNGSYSLHSGGKDGVAIYNTNVELTEQSKVSFWSYCSDVYPNMNMLVWSQNKNTGDLSTGYSGYSYGFGSESFVFSRWGSGSATQLYNSGEILNTGTWYQFIVDRSGETFNLEVQDTNGNTVDTATVTDNNYSKGHYGFNVKGFSPDEPLNWDNVEMTEVILSN